MRGFPLAEKGRNDYTGTVRFSGEGIPGNGDYAHPLLHCVVAHHHHNVGAVALRVGGGQEEVIDPFPDYYIKVNIKGFITLVDYLDGVDFYIPCDMDYDDPTPGHWLAK